MRRAVLMEFCLCKAVWTREKFTVYFDIDYTKVIDKKYFTKLLQKNTQELNNIMYIGGQSLAKRARQKY